MELLVCVVHYVFQLLICLSEPFAFFILRGLPLTVTPFCHFVPDWGNDTRVNSLLMKGVAAEQMVQQECKQSFPTKEWIRGSKYITLFRGGYFFHRHFNVLKSPPVQHNRLSSASTTSPRSPAYVRCVLPIVGHFFKHWFLAFFPYHTLIGFIEILLFLSLSTERDPRVKPADIRLSQALTQPTPDKRGDECLWIKTFTHFLLNKYFRSHQPAALHACLLRPLQPISKASDFEKILIWDQPSRTPLRLAKQKETHFKWNHHRFQAAIYLQPFVSRHSI